MRRARWELTSLAILTLLLQQIAQLINQPLRINQSVSHRVALRVRIHYTRIDSDFQKNSDQDPDSEAQILHKNMRERIDFCIIFKLSKG